MQCRVLLWRSGEVREAEIDVDPYQIALAGSYADLNDLGVKFTNDQRKCAESDFCQNVFVMVSGHVIPVVGWASSVIAPIREADSENQPHENEGWTEDASEPNPEPTPEG